MRVQQLFDPDSSCYSYLVWDADSREAAMIDPVREQAGRDIALIRELGLNLRYTLETHVHTDHVTGSGYLRTLLHSMIVVHEDSPAKYSDLCVRHNDRIPLGSAHLRVIHTPGHTENHICLAIPGAVFTGDSLWIDGCGRTDYIEDGAGRMFDSISHHLFTLDDSTMIYPGHDYQGRCSSTIGREKRRNRRINAATNRDEFIEHMNRIDISRPERIQEALPTNLVHGLPESMQY